MGRPQLILIWVVVMFVSIFVHELGHTLMMRQFQVDSYIVLYSFGGLAVPTSYRRNALPWTQQILISFAGPLAGFILAGIVIGIGYALGGTVFFNRLFGIIPIPSVFLPGSGIGNATISMLLWINIYWGLINLLPVIPLDGGRISQQLFVRFDPWNGADKCAVAVIYCGCTHGCCGIHCLGQFVHVALMFGLLAIQSFQMARGM